MQWKRIVTTAKTREVNYQLFVEMKMIESRTFGDVYREYNITCAKERRLEED